MKLSVFLACRDETCLDFSLILKIGKVAWLIFIKMLDLSLTLYV